MKQYPCEKCGTRHRPTQHHILPKVFFRGYGGICWLCCGCHREIEELIIQAESKYSHHRGVRVKLDAQVYRDILNDFLKGGTSCTDSS